MSIKYIREFNGNIPIILQGNKLVKFDIEYNFWESLSNKNYQFQFEKIINPDMFYRHGSNSRLVKYDFGRGILKRQCNNFFDAIFCENNKIVVWNYWSAGYPNDFTRFKKMLKENGYNIKKDIIYMDSLEEFLFAPLSPTFEDYSESFQREISKEFILSQKAAIIISGERNINNEEIIETANVNPESEDDLFNVF